RRDGSRGRGARDDIVRSDRCRSRRNSRCNCCRSRRRCAASSCRQRTSAPRRRSRASTRYGARRVRQNRAGSMKIALVQTKVGTDVGKNLDKTAQFIKAAARKRAEIVCLQELFAYRYFAQTKDACFFEIAEKLPGRLSQFLSDCAAANRVFL